MKVLLFILQLIKSKINNNGLFLRKDLDSFWSKYFQNYI